MDSIRSSFGSRINYLAAVSLFCLQPFCRKEGSWNTGYFHAFMLNPLKSPVFLLFGLNHCKCLIDGFISSSGAGIYHLFVRMFFDFFFCMNFHPRCRNDDLKLKEYEKSLFETRIQLFHPQSCPTTATVTALCRFYCL